MKLAAEDTHTMSQWPAATLEFCEDFCHSNYKPRYIMGRNIYAESVARLITVDGFIDDYTSDTHYLGLPIARTQHVPPDSLVLCVAGGRPLSARRRLDALGLRNLDYFAFSAVSGLSLVPIRFNEGFQEDFAANRDKYEWIHGLLQDQESIQVFEKLVSFRLSSDLSHLEGFTHREDEQYFEDFLSIQPSDETFIDVGAYDGYTSLEFIRRCPGYTGVHAFEPDPHNFEACQAAIGRLPRVQCYPLGLAESAGEISFDVAGSSSSACTEGNIKIPVQRLDSLLHGVSPTFLKMDIEGAEGVALKGAMETIAKHTPRLAIAVYHVAGDFWRIPEKVLSIHPGYKILLRHYTESIYETVMFFLPMERNS